MGTLSVDKLVKTSQGAAEFTLPATDGTVDQVMKTDGAGQLGFTTISADPTMGGDLSGLSSNAQIVANAVTTTEIVDDAVTIAKLAATGTASATTFLRGDNAWTAIGDVGKVLQYQYSQAHGPGVSSTNNATYVSAGSTFLISITPSATTSKIIVNFGSARAGSSSDSYEGRIKIYRQIDGGGYSEIEAGLWQATVKGIAYRPLNITYVDSTHNTTSQIDYQLYIASSGNISFSLADSSPSLRWINATEIGV